MASTSRTKMTSTTTAALIFALAAMASAQDDGYSPVGCYTSSQPLDSQGEFTYQSYGHCYDVCTGLGAPVMALTQGSTCYCGDMLPPASSKTSSSACNVQCQGFPGNICGGQRAFSVLLTGLSANVPTYGSTNGDSSSSDSSSPTTSTSSPTTTDTQLKRPTTMTSVLQGTTVIVTQTPEATAGSSNSDSSSGGGTSVAGIAAGVVVGVLAVIAIIVGVYFLLRRRKKQAAEEEYKRTQVSDFMRGGERKPPGTGYSQMSDSRLDPEAGARRDSHGSIADNQDYSRRVLRVANPDRS